MRSDKFGLRSQKLNLILLISRVHESSLSNYKKKSRLKIRTVRYEELKKRVQKTILIHKKAVRVFFLFSPQFIFSPGRPTIVVLEVVFHAEYDAGIYFFFVFRVIMCAKRGNDNQILP